MTGRQEWNKLISGWPSSSDASVNGTQAIDFDYLYYSWDIQRWEVAKNQKKKKTNKKHQQRNNNASDDVNDDTSDMLARLAVRKFVMCVFFFIILFQRGISRQIGIALLIIGSARIL